MSLITSDEIGVARYPSEYINWFESYLEKTRTNKSFRKRIIKRNGIFKEVYEEVFPIYRLLQKFGLEWSDCRFRNVIGSQNYDVDITGEGDQPFDFIEVTVADATHKEQLRMDYFAEHGTVSFTGDVSWTGTRKTGHDIQISEDMSLHRDLNNKKLTGITDAIAKKSKKEYRDNTALLVYFDDYTAFSDEHDEEQFKTFFERLDDCWQSKFSELFIIGASGKNCWRKTGRTRLCI